MATTAGIRVFAKAHRLLLRLSGGRLGGTLRGGQVVLLTTTGRKTGRARTWPLVAIPRDGDWLVIGSNGGGDAHPSWLLNLRAHPGVTLEVAGKGIAMRAREAAGAERDALWAFVVGEQPVFATYETRTDRTIPVVVLTPAADAER